MERWRGREKQAVLSYRAEGVGEWRNEENNAPSLKGYDFYKNCRSRHQEYSWKIET